VTSGHPWVFAGEIEALPSPDQVTAPLFDRKGRFFGNGMVNHRSQIVWRRYATTDIPFDDQLVRARIERAIALRKNSGFGDICRLFWSESDGIPGLVIDIYKDVVVVQALTLLVDRCFAGIVEILVELLHPRAIVARNDAPVRE
jgi:23S rRNA (cytosine1962-C5)-methyltransferase